MPDYIKVKPKPFHLQDSPNDWWTQFTNDIRTAEAKNREMYQAARQAHSKMLELSIIAYGKNSKEYKYLKSRWPDNVPSFTRMKNSMQRKWELFLQKEENRQYYRDYRARHREAVERLEEAGYIPGEDFPKGKAITFEKRLKNEPIESEESEDAISNNGLS